MSDDKTEDPTPKRKKENRQKGNIPKSQELSTWGAMLLGSMVLPVTIRSANGSVRELFVQMGEAIAAPEIGSAMGLVGAGSKAFVSSVLPLAIAMMAFGILSNVGQTGFVFATKKLKPSAKNLNPLAGMKRLFSPQSGWNTFKILARTAVLLLAAWMPLSSMIDRMSVTGRQPLVPMLASVGKDGAELVRLVCIAGLLLGILDFVVTKRRSRKQMKMSKQEIKDESRSADGDPQMKGQIKAKQRELSRNRMLAAVGDASVVIVNPTHVAVALKYEPGGGAPRLVAKGKGEIAKKIRERAAEHRVPMVRDVPLARALHDTCKLDHPVPADLYAAVAKVLAFVLTVGKRAAAFGGAVTLPAR